MNRIRWVAIMYAAVVVLASSPAAGQSVSVRVLERETASPIIGALVQLVRDSALVEQRLTDEAGRAVLPPDGPGPFRLRVRMIGMRPVETEPFVLAGGSHHENVSLVRQPLGLEGLAVAVGERCRVRPESSLTTRVWREARTALTIAALADDQGMYRYETMLYEHDLDREAEVVLEERRSRREASMRTPFRSRPALELMERGFRERSGEVDLYFAPDADVLLSEEFLDVHCFRLTPGAEGDETEGLIGLAFEPLRVSGRRVDVSGTLWLDPATSELRWLDYRYENLDPDIRANELGGRVEFRRMPDGGWIVPRWWIRMPRVAVQRVAGGRSRRYVAGIREAGGLVLDVEAAGSSMVRVRTGTIEGIVTDSLGGRAAGARVTLLGTGREATTDAAGAYRLPGLVDGAYRVRFGHPGLRRYGYRSEPVTREVVGGEASYADFSLPSVAAVTEVLCRERPTRLAGAEELPAQGRGGQGTLIGRILDADTDQPLSGATVRAGRSEWSLVLWIDRATQRTHNRLTEEPYSFETSTDETGLYVLCDLPEAWSLAVSARHEGFVSEPDTVRIASGGVLEHTVRISRKPVG